jgi:hypothetical protein
MLHRAKEETDIKEEVLKGTTQETDKKEEARRGFTLLRIVYIGNST